MTFDDETGAGADDGSGAAGTTIGATVLVADGVRVTRRRAGLAAVAASAS